ncbi:MAG: hypothetical protein EAZ18_24420 [Oscillatoriales cyanobacterium]|nr:MAG: hypothetical protein EAZ18_24420 [Oscillatoriales cyanobacterium]
MRSCTILNKGFLVPIALKDTQRLKNPPPPAINSLIDIGARCQLKPTEEQDAHPTIKFNFCGTGILPVL